MADDGQVCVLWGRRSCPQPSWRLAPSCSWTTSLPPAGVGTELTWCCEPCGAEKRILIAELHQ